MEDKYPSAGRSGSSHGLMAKGRKVAGTTEVNGKQKGGETLLVESHRNTSSCQ